jgi:hypothetical protein
MSLQFTGQPADGDTVGVTLTLPDGSTDTINLTATTGTPGAGQFQVGADTTATAANFQAALKSAIQADTPTKLAAASNVAAANDFFNSSGQGVRRAAVGPDGTYATATDFETPTQTASDTVQWYNGESSASSAGARASVTTKVDGAVKVTYGVEANEQGIAQLVRSLAVQAIQTYPTDSDANTAASRAKFDIVANDTQSALSGVNATAPGSLTAIGVDLGLTQVTLKNLPTSTRRTRRSCRTSSPPTNRRTRTRWPPSCCNCRRSFRPATRPWPWSPSSSSPIISDAVRAA